MTFRLIDIVPTNEVVHHRRCGHHLPTDFFLISLSTTPSIFFASFLRGDIIFFGFSHQERAY